MILVRSFYAWMDADTRHYIGVALFFLAILLFCVCAPYLLSRPTLTLRVPSRWKAFLLSPATFCAATLLCLLAFRWPAMFYPAEMNFDESLVIARAHRLSTDLVPWRSAIFGTSGPLSSYALLPLSLLGIPYDYLLARLTGLLCIWITISFTYLGMREWFGEKTARLAVFPTALFYAGAFDENFVHYTSEHVPLALLSMGSCFGIFAISGRWNRSLALFLCGLFLGAVGFAKLQGLPIALFITAAVAAVVFVQSPTWKTRFQSLLFLAMGGLSVPGLFATVIAVTGSFEDFWITSVRVASVYGVPFLRPGMWIPFLLSSREFYFYLAGLLGFGLWAGAFLVAKKEKLPRPILVHGILVLGYLLVALFVVLKPGRTYRHYLHFLMTPLTYSAGYLLAVAREKWVVDAETTKFNLRAPVSARVALTFLLIGCLPLFAGFSQRWLHFVVGARETWVKALESSGFVTNDAWWWPDEPWAPAWKQGERYFSVDPHPIVHLLHEVTDPGDSLAVWGRYPDLYIRSGLVPAVRDVNTRMAMVEDKKINLPPDIVSYYQETFLADLIRAHPPVFIDSVNDGALIDPYTWEDRTNRAKFGHETFPRLADYIRNNYVMWLEYGNQGTGVRIDLSKQRLQEILSGKFGEVRGIQAPGAVP